MITTDKSDIYNYYNACVQFEWALCCFAAELGLWHVQEEGCVQEPAKYGMIILHTAASSFTHFHTAVRVFDSQLP